MKHSEILEIREKNKILLLAYFTRLQIDTIEDFIYNGRNNQCPALTAFSDEANFKNYNQAFGGSIESKGGDYYTWSKYANNKYKLSVSIKDGWN